MSMEISKRYNEIKPGNTSKLSTNIVSFLPKPTEDDYARGYINRFFAQKSNDKSAPIYEVSNVEFSKLKSNPMFTLTTLRWRITGPKDTQYNEDGVVTDKGVRESNRISTKLASDVITNLKLYLPNTIQFYRNG